MQHQLRRYLSSSLPLNVTTLQNLSEPRAVILSSLCATSYNEYKKQPEPLALRHTIALQTSSISRITVDSCHEQQCLNEMYSTRQLIVLQSHLENSRRLPNLRNIECKTLFLT